MFSIFQNSGQGSRGVQPYSSTAEFLNGTHGGINPRETAKVACLYSYAENVIDNSSDSRGMNEAGKQFAHRKPALS